MGGLGRRERLLYFPGLATLRHPMGVEYPHAHPGGGGPSIFCSRELIFRSNVSSAHQGLKEFHLVNAIVTIVGEVAVPGGSSP